MVQKIKQKFQRKHWNLKEFQLLHIRKSICKIIRMFIKITLVKIIKGKYIPLGILNVCGRNTSRCWLFWLTKSSLREVVGEMILYKTWDTKLMLLKGEACNQLKNSWERPRAVDTETLNFLTSMHFLHASWRKEQPREFINF